MVCRFVSGVPSGRTNNYAESERGLGHVTLTIFGSTVGYPSDSLASCLYRFLADRTNYGLAIATVLRLLSSVMLCIGPCTRPLHTHVTLVNK